MWKPIQSVFVIVIVLFQIIPYYKVLWTRTFITNQYNGMGSFKLKTENWQNGIFFVFSTIQTTKNLSAHFIKCKTRFLSYGTFLLTMYLSSCPYKEYITYCREMLEFKKRLLMKYPFNLTILFFFTYLTKRCLDKNLIFDCICFT